MCGLNFSLIEPHWVEAFHIYLQLGEIWPRVLLNMHSEHHQPEEIYHRIVNTEEPLVFFHAGAADNLRATMSVLEAVAAEAGVSDLAALEAEIKATDQKIDQLVYELYGLTDKEIALVEQGR